MKLTPKIRSILVNEINVAVDHMNSTKNPTEKLYYFSAVYAAINRVMNIEFDPELVLVNLVTNSGYNMINTSLKSIKEGLPVVTFGENLFTKLEDCLKQLANNIEKDEPTFIALQAISNIAYSTTGNGNYLVLKGQLKI